MMIFKFHTLYTFAQIAQIAAPQLPVHPGLISGLVNHVSVIGPDFEQYDFTGADEDHLVLVLLDYDSIIDHTTKEAVRPPERPC